MHQGMPNIFLVGPMGSGKTTIGARLARKLDLEFYDCDQEIEARSGASVTLIFEIEGEKGFRQRESRMLRELAGRDRVLIATGGGSVMDESNQALLREHGIVVYLRTSVTQQLERLRRDRSRPLLQTRNRELKLKEMADIRNPLYESVADLVFPVKDRNIDSTVNQIYQQICAYVEDTHAKPADVSADGN
jgi:shikimate kinase